MMLDLPDEQVSEQPDFRRYLNIARRRQLQFVLPLFVGWLLVWGSSWILKPLQVEHVDPCGRADDATGLCCAEREQ
jgi:hypothetical protein